MKLLEARAYFKNITEISPEFLKENGMLCEEKHGRVDYYVSDMPNNFDTCAAVFMGGALGGNIQKVNIE